MALWHWVQLGLTEGIGPILARRLIDAAGGAEPACNPSMALLRTIEGIGAAKSQQIFDSLKQARDDAQREIDRAASIGVTILCPDDQAYPALLGSIPDPPSTLYAKGSIEPRDLNALAIVGSRRCSFYGREQAERFGSLLAGAGMTVVSGGARGIDSAAHRGAIAAAQGRTVAVLGCGVDVVYPPENAALFGQIEQRGAVVSEYPLGTPPVAENFPRRNRIVSGISRGVLVIEADQRSGALITARQACDDHGRPVFAMPGRVDNRMSNGPHQLIRDGAILVTSLEDILDGLDPLPQGALQPALFDSENDGAPGGTTTETITPREVESLASLSERQRKIFLGIDTEPTGIDTIIERSTLPVHIVLQELTFLSLKGAVRRIDGQTYARRN